MTDGIKRIIHIFILLMAITLPSASFGKSIQKGGVSLQYDELQDGTILVTYAENKSPDNVMILIDGKDAGTLLSGSGAKINKVAEKHVKTATNKRSGPTLWSFQPKPEPARQPDSAPETPGVNEETSQPEDTRVSPAPKRDKGDAGRRVSVPPLAPDVPFYDRIECHEFFGNEALKAFADKCVMFVNGLDQSGDKDQFLIDNDIDKFISDSEAEIKDMEGKVSEIVQTIIRSSGASDKYSGLVEENLISRLDNRRKALDTLKEAVDKVRNVSESENPLMDNLVNYIIVGVIVLVLLIWMFFAIIKKQKKSKSKAQKAVTVATAPAGDDGNPTIIVRRRTTSILKKQNIDDVINDPAYLAIHTSDFTSDSAVRTIYVKNTCIKEVYNMYATDLRNSDNPKEDGCMVLGRWVFDPDSRTYDVTLEYVIFPGDDAVFKEYELNFGGKIKLRVADRLRKLRRETGLQYDLTCWIHSHPGLGVFFSNSDDNVQMQLKHASHPNFLVAFVVDILTSDQEMGIFTFRRDGSMNSKNDIHKMYSLEEMFKWALKSVKNSFSPDSYYNILGGAALKTSSCKGIELNNNAIIDLTQIVLDPIVGIAGWAIGTPIETNHGMEYAVSSIAGVSDRPKAGVMGAVVCTTVFNVDEVKRFLGAECAGMHFVMAYSSVSQTVTTIPVENGRMLTDSQFFGVEKIDDLKIWTRRKR